MQQTHTALLKWYKEHGRHTLPWRNTNNLYHIYLSEVMLQQTQVSRVEQEYYPRFLERFPTLQSLADAPQQEVLGLWSGLGYYSRARNLHKTAQLVASKGLAHSEKELVKLPGIGRYTASAICCFGLNQPIAVVDTNIKRVIKRYFALEEADDKTVWSYAKEFVNIKEPRAHNLALMDLGSQVCTPKEPACKVCPLSFTCKGKTEPHRYIQRKKTKYESLELFFGIHVKDGKVALVPSEGSMYKGLLTLPQTDPIEENHIGSFKHSYTKYRLTVHLYSLEEFEQENITWVALEDFATSHISSLTKKAQPFFTKAQKW